MLTRRGVSRGAQINTLRMT